MHRCNTVAYHPQWHACPSRRLGYAPGSRRFAPCFAESESTSQSRTAKTVAVSVPNPDSPSTPLTISLTLPQQHGLKAVALQKPLGLALTEQAGQIVIDEVVDGGHASAAECARDTSCEPQPPGHRQVITVISATAGALETVLILNQRSCMFTRASVL